MTKAAVPQPRRFMRANNFARDSIAPHRHPSNAWAGPNRRATRKLGIHARQQPVQTASGPNRQATGPDANFRVRPVARQPPDDDHQNVNHRFSLLRRMFLLPRRTGNFGLSDMPLGKKLTLLTAFDSPEPPETGRSVRFRAVRAYYAVRRLRSPFQARRRSFLSPTNLISLVANCNWT